MPNVVYTRRIMPDGTLGWWRMEYLIPPLRAKFSTIALIELPDLKAYFK